MLNQRAYMHMYNKYKIVHRSEMPNAFSPKSVLLPRNGRY